MAYGALRQLETALFKAFLEEPEPMAVPIENFQAIAAAVKEHNQTPRQRVINADPSNLATESIKSFAHIGRRGEQKDRGV
jgi:hypothetical protein